MWTDIICMECAIKFLITRQIVPNVKYSNIGNISEQFNAVSGNFIRTPMGRGVFSRLSAENFLSIAPLSGQTHEAKVG